MGRYKGSKREERSLDAFVKLMRASETVQIETTHGLAAAGLTVSQFGVLEALYHIGPLCLSDLAKKILKSGGNLTLVVDNLEKRGLARRVPGERDKRYTVVQLTEKGEKLISDIFPDHADLISRVMGRLSAGEQESLAALCKKLGTGEEPH